MKNIITQHPRPGCKDIWNAFMVEGATMTQNDIPVTPTTATSPPADLITYDDARVLVKKNIRSGNRDFHSDAYVCWYMDDYKFDNSEGAWQKPFKARDILEHFSGIVSPDWSMYADFPVYIKHYNLYRMRAFGYWYGTILGHNHINNVRWGTEETYSYCFDGIPFGSMVALGCIASDLRSPYNHILFKNGLDELIRRISPPVIIIYGSISEDIMEHLKSFQIDVKLYPGKRSKRREVEKHEQTN